MHAVRRPFWALGLLAISLTLTGCGKMEPVRFRLNTQGIDPQEFVGPSAPKDTEEKTDAQKKRETLEQISTILYAWFGTPDEPFVMPESGLDLRKVQMAAGPSRFDPDSNQRGLYRRHCAHCHGISGDGAGPTAAFLNPYPRDYRQGNFKFKSTVRSARPTNDDLKRILHEGIAGTAMPSFLLLPPDEIDALVEYVKYLAMRGQVELLFQANLQEGDLIDMANPADLIASNLTPVAEAWQNAESEILEAEAQPEFKDEAEKTAFIAKGAVLFQNEKVQCAKCHGPTALGDGSEEALYDDWNKVKQFDVIAKNIAEAEKQAKEPASTPEEAKDRKEQLAKLYRDFEAEKHKWLLPAQQLQPRNLRLGIYRFGRRPIDVYRRISQGINGTPMGTMGATPDSPSGLKPEEIWQLVYYVRSLPYEAVSEPSVGRGHMAGIQP